MKDKILEILNKDRITSAVRGQKVVFPCDFEDVADEIVDIQKLKWISVNERMPKEPDRYMVTVKHTPSGRISVLEMVYLGSKRGFVHHLSGGGRQDAVETHWMPLPEPPKQLTEPIKE